MLLPALYATTGGMYSGIKTSSHCRPLTHQICHRLLHVPWHPSAASLPWHHCCEPCSQWDGTCTYRGKKCNLQAAENPVSVPLCSLRCLSVLQLALPQAVLLLRRRVDGSGWLVTSRAAMVHMTEPLLPTVWLQPTFCYAAADQLNQAAVNICCRHLRAGWSLLLTCALGHCTLGTCSLMEAYQRLCCHHKCSHLSM